MIIKLTAIQLLQYGLTQNVLKKEIFFLKLKLYQALYYDYVPYKLNGLERLIGKTTTDDDVFFI